MDNSPLLLQERQQLIQQRLQAEGRVLALELALQMNVSEDTIRRDLREMAAAGLCRRVYGGALPPLPAAPDGSTLAQRLTEAPERKAGLARTAATLVKAGQVLFIDAGSTNLALCAVLPALPLTVVTNAPAIAMLLLERPQIEVIITGGRLDARSGASLGPSALRDASQLRPDLYFIGACGADVEAGITAAHFDEAEFKRSLALRSRAVVAIVTNDKLGTAAPYEVLPPARLQHLVLEADAVGAHSAGFAELGVQVLHAAPSHQTINPTR